MSVKVVIVEIVNQVGAAERHFIAFHIYCIERELIHTLTEVERERKKNTLAQRKEATANLSPIGHF